MSAKKMLVLTGPQGAGNHLWSKIFSLHPEVYGWKTLLDNYWEAHRYAEPFAECWKNLDLLKEFDWSQSDYYFTSISCPLGIQDSLENPIWMPDIIGFINRVKDLGINVQIAICGRDQTILQYQQSRVRGRETKQQFLNIVDELMPYNPLFISQELLYLYKHRYIKSLGDQLNFPVSYDDSRIEEILKSDANSKYFTQIERTELDYITRKVSKLGD